MFFFKFFLDISLSQKTMITFPFLDYSLLCSVGCPIRKRKTVNVCSSFFCCFSFRLRYFYLSLSPLLLLLFIVWKFVQRLEAGVLPVPESRWESVFWLRLLLFICASASMCVIGGKNFQFFSSFQFNWSVSVKRYLN